MPITFIVTDGPNAGDEYLFTEAELSGGRIAGRSVTSQLQMLSNDLYFSRNHFILDAQESYVVSNLGRNGTLVNGRRVEGPTPLRDGDVVRVGGSLMVVSLTAPATVALNGTGSHPPLQAPVGPPVEIPGFELVEKAGEGQMGVVYRARRLADGAELAVKVLKTPASLGAGRDAKRFQREVKALQALRHPNIISFHEAGAVGDRRYFVIDFIPGHNLEEQLRQQGPFTIRLAVRVTCQLLSALDHAHQAKIVHRDVKPSNVMVAGGPSGGRQVKLTDFGLARFFESPSFAGPSQAGEFCGTPGFMAPEQVCDPARVGPASDVFGAAATLYKLLTGEVIYENLPRASVMQLMAIPDAVTVPLRDRRPEVPSGLAAAIEQALERNPERRFKSAKAFRRALGHYGE